MESHALSESPVEGCSLPPNIEHAVLRQAKTKELKNSLNQEFRLIHELCLFVLSASQRADLIRATLSTLHAFLSWVPVGYIFESNVVEVLLKLFPQAPFRNIALQCLTEVRILSLCPGSSHYHPGSFGAAVLSGRRRESDKARDREVPPWGVPPSPARAVRLLLTCPMPLPKSKVCRLLRFSHG
jgi:hypothetical protein